MQYNLPKIFIKSIAISFINDRRYSYIVQERSVEVLKDYIEKRAVELAEYIIKNNATVRKTAKEFNISKSTVHKDVHERLKKINPHLYNEAQSILEFNKSERHIRGGIATREKYLQISKTRD